MGGKKVANQKASGKATPPHSSFSIYKYLLLAVLLMLAGDLMMRLVFFFYNAFGGWEFSWGDVPLALLVGLRFDLATLAIVNGLFLVAMALPVLGGRGLRILSFLLVLFHLPVLFLNGVDVIYYGFSSKRLSHEFFSGGAAAYNFGLNDALPYWWLILLVFALAAGQLWLLFRASRKVQPPAGLGTVRRILAWCMPVVLAGALFLAFRGGFQIRPLRPASAFVTNSMFLSNVSLNSAYTVAQSIEIGNESEPDLMPMPDAIAIARQAVHNDFDAAYSSDEYPLLRQAQFAGPEQKYNVVLLIVESFNASKMGALHGKALGESLTPNLDTLARRGRLYTNFSSNGARSVQSLPAILNSTPDIFDRPLIGSSFETNQQWGIGNMLSHRGYHTSFVCGGPNGTLGFDAYSKVSGFKEYFGHDDIAVADAAASSKWGLHDHEVLQWLADRQIAHPKPFLDTWFSISNHFPFDTPADCPAAIAQSSLSPMDKTVKYTDWALGQYFARVLKEEWAANTIFVVTGDHCFYFENDPDRGDVQNFHVPLLLLGPGVPPGVDDRIGSHVSILPTLIELLQLKTRYAAVGVSLLSKQNESFGITGLVGALTFARQHRFLSATLDHAMSWHGFSEGKWQMQNEIGETPAGQEMHETLRAIYQVCSFIRRNNKQNLPIGMGE